MSGLRLSLLGPPLIECCDQPVTIKLRKAVALLAYLAMTGRAHRRDTLATLFWPELDQSRARAGLRYALAAIRTALGKGWLEADRELLALAPGAEVWLDVAVFRAKLASCETHGHERDHVCPACLPALAAAVELYRDDFLAGFTLRDSPGFDEWQFFQAEELRDCLAGALERLVDGHTGQEEFETAITYARRWVALDPLHEPAHRALIRLYAWSGQRAAGLRQYEECQRLLQAELGVAPEAETAELYETLKDERDLPPPEPRAAAPPEPGLLKARYRLDVELGRGSGGVVYRARDLVLERNVAVKVLSPQALGSTGRARLLEEAQAAAQLNHPHIASIYDAGESEGTFFLVTELAEGETLRTHRPQELAEILSICAQVCAALEHAHSHGIVHRDLKPENILITTGGTAKLADFGLARPVASRITSEGAITGTVFYLAPELALGQEIDGRADLYALGVILYELTTGRLPFTADEPVAVISQHLHAPVVPPRAREAGIPPALDDLIVRLLSKDPQDRPASAARVGQILGSPGILEADSAPPEEIFVLKRIRRGRLVGREEELQQARELWNRVLAGRGQALLISGESGIGKTRLVRELATQVQVLGGRALTGACYAEGGVPYAPVVQIVRQALEGDAPGELQLPEFVLTDLITLAPALRLRYPDLDPAPALDDPAAEQHRLFENLGIFVAAASRQVPLLLVIEDIHWARDGSLALLRHLVRHTREERVLIVATYRPVEQATAAAFHETLLDLCRERLVTLLGLSRLDREQTRQMLAALFAEEITPELRDGIYHETDGNPFFIEEVCKALVESGKVYFQDGRWHRPSVAELGIPRSVRVAIQSRIQALPAGARATLHLAAILGRQFDFETLVTADAGHQGEEALIEAIESALQAQLLEEISNKGGGTFSFVHTLIPSTLIESTGALERRRLHRQAAVALEARRPDDWEGLAYHYDQAGQAGRAADYWLQAGDRARGLYAQQEAIANYQKALEIYKARATQPETAERALERAARTLMKLGLTYNNAFDFQAARQAYQEGFALWQRMAEAVPSELPPPHALRVTAFEPGSLSPGVAMDHPSAVLQDQLFSGLVEVSPDMSLVPDVARSWEVLEGGRKYVFHLRDDVRWSDGVPVTASDFEYSWKRALAPAREWPAVKLLYDIQGARAYSRGEMSDPERLGVRALDELTLAVELEGPTSYFPYILAFSPMYPVPRHVEQVHSAAWTEVEHIVTNGPFRLAARRRGESLVLQRNPDYHGRFTGNVERVECTILDGPPTRFLQMYVEDRLDVCGGLPPTEMVRAVQRYAGEYVSGPWLSFDMIGFDASRPPFDDARVRQALTLATDRETLAHVTLRGYAFPATGGLVPPGMPGHSPHIGLPYDPERARRLLADAGYPQGHNFPVIDCVVRDDPGHDLLCEYLQTHWRETLGLQIEWRPVKWARFPEIMAKEHPHLWMVGWWADYPDPDDILRIMWWRPPGWQNEAYDSLVERAQRAMDQRERLQMYQQADQTLIAEAPLLPLCYARLHMLVKPWVRRYRTSAMKWWFWKDVILEPH